MKSYARLTAVFVLSSLVFLWPFAMRMKLPLWGVDFSSGMETIFANYDGPNYVIAAKSLYDKQFIGANFSNPLPLEYYPAHLPLYPLMIALTDIILPGPVAMLVVALLGGLLAVLMFYRFISEFRLTRYPMFLTIVFMFLPARWLAVRNVGSPEGWFVFFIIACFYFYRKKNLWLSALFGVLSQWTKSPGILIFVGFQLYFLYQTFWEGQTVETRLRMIADRFLSPKKVVLYVPTLGRWTVEFVRKNLENWQLWLIPLSVVPMFWFYQWRTGDFWAYFNSGDNFHLFWPPFSIFSPQGQYWVGEFWLEDVIYIWLVFGLGILKYLKKIKVSPEGLFALVFFVSTLFVSHRDISRYILPVAPFVLLGWERLVGQKEFKWIFILLLIPLYLFAYNFALNNAAPVADWTPYL